MDDARLLVVSRRRRRRRGAVAVVDVAAIVVFGDFPTSRGDRALKAESRTVVAADASATAVAAASSTRAPLVDGDGEEATTMFAAADQNRSAHDDANFINLAQP